MAEFFIKEYRRIGNWENFFLDSAIYSVGVSLGIEYPNGFVPIAAQTGDLFAYMYSDQLPCDSGVTNYIFNQDAVRRAYAMFGYDTIFYSPEDIMRDYGSTYNAIKKSVERNLPALMWGCGGVLMNDGMRYDPLPEGCIIGGYNTDEDILLVSLYPGAERLAEHSANGRPGVDEYGYTAISTRDALATTYGIFIVGDKITPTPREELYKYALSSIKYWLNYKNDDYLFGAAAFRRWSEVMLDDANWSEPSLCEINSWVKHGSAYCSLCTSIGVGDGEGIAGYIRDAVETLELSNKDKILDCFIRLRRMNQRIWELSDGFLPSVERLMTHELRRDIAGALVEMGDICDELNELPIL